MIPSPRHGVPGSLKKHQIFPSRFFSQYLCISLLGLLAATQAQNEANPNPRSAAVDRWRSFLWLFEGPEAGPPLFEALKRLGVSGTNVNGTTPSHLHHRHGVPFYVDHLAGKGDLALREETWKRIRLSFLGSPDAPGKIRPACFLAPETKARLFKRMGEVSAQAEPNSPLAYSLDDEISITHRNEPFDFCFCERCREAFSVFVLKRHGGRENGRAMWPGTGSNAPDFTMPTTQEVRRRELFRDPSVWNLADWSDRLAFMDQTFEDLIADLSREADRLRIQAPVGFSGGEAPHPMSGVDWSRLLPHVDFVEPYDVGGSRELVRSFARPGTAVFSTLFFDLSTDFRVHRHQIWDYFLRGNHGLILWSAKEFFRERDPQKPSPWAEALAPTLRELSSDSLAEWVNAEPDEPAVLMMESTPSNRIHWMLDSRDDGRTWINRGGSYEAEHSSQNRTREAWQKLLEDIHIDYVHVDAEQPDEQRWNRAKVLILPRTTALSDSSGRRVRDFAKRGTIVADCQTGLFDEHLRARATPLLDDVFGVRRKNRTVYLKEANYTGPDDLVLQMMPPAEPGVSPGGEAVAVMRAGDQPLMFDWPRESGGRSVYMNMLLVNYLDQRLTGRDEHPLQREIRGLLRSAGVRAPVEIRFPGGDSIPVRVFLRKSAKATYLGIIANWRTSTTPVRYGEFSTRAAPRIEILLPKSAVVTDLRTGNLVGTGAHGLRKTSSFTTSLPLFEGLIYRLEF